MQFKQAEEAVLDYESLLQRGKEIGGALRAARRRTDELLTQTMGKPYHGMSNEDWHDFYARVQDEEVFGLNSTSQYVPVKVDMDMKVDAAALASPPTTKDPRDTICQACTGCRPPNTPRETCQFSTQQPAVEHTE